MEYYAKVSNKQIRASYESMFIDYLDQWPPNVGFTVPTPGQQTQHSKGTDLFLLYFFKLHRDSHGQPDRDHYSPCSQEGMN